MEVLGGRGQVLAVIPARFASTRFPGKPLADIDGKPMIVRVAERVRSARRIDQVWVATDDERIRSVAVQAGFQTRMTPPECASGTDRVHAALDGAADAALILNVQGDEPLIDPADLDVLVAETLASSADAGTLARPLDDTSRYADPNVVKVVRAQNGRALYFSRSPIPHGSAQPLLHVGVYAYRPAALDAIARSSPTPLERSERLEQLRALELGFSIQVVDAVSKTPAVAVDVPEDVARVVSILRSLRSDP